MAIARAIGMKWLDKVHARHAAVINWLAEKAKTSWLFSVALMLYVVWEICYHFLLPLLLAGTGLFWFMER